MKTAVGNVATDKSAGKLDASAVLQLGRRILQMEAAAIETAADRLGDQFVRAVETMLACRGRVAVTGMGKAGNVGRKIQATLASTATPAYCIHPAEALHGDLGMIRPDDVVLALSKSGETQELCSLLPALKRLGCRVILVTARCQSRCAGLADIVLDIGESREACPLGLAPSSSTTAMLAMGDALALTVMELKNVRPEQYAAFHPGGALGRSLMRVRQIMRTGDSCPTVSVEDSLDAYYTAVERATLRAGAAAVVDGDGKLVGFFTHGDLFRLRPGSFDPHQTPMSEIMTASPKFAAENDLVPTALRLMQQYRIDELPVVDDAGRLVGLLDIQDLIAKGYSAFDDQ